MKYLLVSILSLSLFISQAQSGQDTVAIDSTQFDEVRSLISFYNYMLNTVGASKTSTRDKEVIIIESYKKIFNDGNVQIEDDLILDRQVITNKDVNAYLRDVDFFFNEIRFDFKNVEIQKIAKGEDDFFYLISFESTIEGTTIENEPISDTKNRFIEVNINQEKSDLKIASIYSTKVSRTKELQNWWADLSFGWVRIFEEYVSFDSLNDQVLLKIASIDSLNISGNPFILDIEPLSALKDLKIIDISNTKVDDLNPLRYSRNLRKLDASNTTISTIESLQYFDNLTTLNLSKTNLEDISIISRLQKLESLNLSDIQATDFSPITGLNELKYLNLSNTSFFNTELIVKNIRLERVDLSRTAVTNLDSFKALTQIKELNISETSIADVNGLDSHPNLETLFINQTLINDLTPLFQAPKLKKVYADNTGITEQSASAFMTKKFETVVVSNSEQVMKWWNGLSANWKNTFSEMMGQSDPQKEDIIKLLNRDSLDVSNKRLIEHDPLKKFRRLKYLNVSNNLFTSFEFSEDMEDLEFLKGEKLSVESTKGLEKNLNLRFIVLKGSLLKNIQSLSYLNKLESIDADNTSIGDVQVAGYMDTNSKAVIIYQSERLRNWWNELPEAWKKELSPEKADSYFLHELTQRQEIAISDPSISSLEPLSAFNNLKKITLDQIRMSNLSELFIHKNLRELTCTNGPLQNLEGITQLDQLESLNISNTAIENLSELEGLVSLKHLNCSGIGIKNLKGISGLTNMESIDFSNTRVWKLERLYGMSNLRKLVCYNTRVREHTIEAFKTVFPDCEITFY